jgi:hypothetical protein
MIKDLFYRLGWLCYVSGCGKACRWISGGLGNATSNALVYHNKESCQFSKKPVSVKQAIMQIACYKPTFHRLRSPFLVRCEAANLINI